MTMTNLPPPPECPDIACVFCGGQGQLIGPTKFTDDGERVVLRYKLRDGWLALDGDDPRFACSKPGCRQLAAAERGGL